MRLKTSFVIGVALLGIGFAAGMYWSGDGIRGAVSRAAFGVSPRPELSQPDVAIGRGPIDEQQTEIVRVPLPVGRRVPQDEHELAQFVAWLRRLGREELLRLSNAEFEFQESELVEMLQQLTGEWVVPALGNITVAETDPLLKAILVKGLMGTVSNERVDDERIVPILDSLMSQMSRASEDPHDVANDLAAFAHVVCLRGEEDYVRLMSEHLLNSDNSGFLIQGYLFMGSQSGGPSILKQVLTAHSSSAGRLGALEGLRMAAADGRIQPGEVTSLGLAALDGETNERNRLLLYEMMISTGGEEGLTAVEQMLRSGNVSELGSTVELLALEMDTERARALFQDLLRDHQLEGDAKQAVYNAMGLLKGGEGVDLLLDLARNDDLDDSERLAGLRGLWNQPVDERLEQELRDVFDSGSEAALRTEALRMLVYGESEGAGVDLRSIAVLDDDPAVRAEAVQMAAMQPSEDTRAWLEQRLLEDRSMDVKAAALGALVYQAHYTGDGDAVLGYLERARKFTGDEEALAMIAEGERMVKDHDPRNLELGLAKEAEFYGMVAQYTDGPASRAFQRQAKQLGQIVTALRATRDGRRPAR